MSLQPSRKKSAGLVSSPERSPRIGYVNVNGLYQLKWESCLRVLHMSFDFLFLAEGLQIGVAGGLMGLVSGLAWCVFIEKVGIKLDPEVYYMPALPVRIEPFQTALAVVVAILVTFFASIYPALQASLLELVEGLKAE